MAHEIKIPSVGESITSATVGTWLKADGEYVESGEEVLMIETDKVSTGIPTETSGILKHQANEGDDLDIDVPSAWFERRQRTRGVAEFVWRVMLAER